MGCAVVSVACRGFTRMQLGGCVHHLICCPTDLSIMNFYERNQTAIESNLSQLTIMNFYERNQTAIESNLSQSRTSRGLNVQYGWSASCSMVHFCLSPVAIVVVVVEWHQNRRCQVPSINPVHIRLDYLQQHCQARVHSRLHFPVNGVGPGFSIFWMYYMRSFFNTRNPHFRISPLSYGTSSTAKMMALTVPADQNLSLIDVSSNRLLIVALGKVCCCTGMSCPQRRELHWCSRRRPTIQKSR